MKVLYLDGSAGISGNMFLAACIDLGFPIETLIKTVNSFPIPPVQIKVETVYKQGIRSVYCDVIPEEKRHEGTLSDFVNVIKKSLLPNSQKERAISMFNRLAIVEGRIHGKPPEAVHFHELGGWDTLVDVAGAVVAVEWLGVTEIIVGNLDVGSGFADTEHGRVSVPAPATSELLKEFAIYSSGIKGELVTPTGALIVSSLGRFGAHPPMIAKGLGYGAGSMNLPIPNCLKVFLGEAVSKVSSEERIMKLECNLDDMNPEWLDYAMDRLYSSGALEVFMTPVHMKKNRPGILLSALAPIEKLDELQKILFLETTTLGIRFKEWSRKVLERRIVSVETKWGKVRIKEGLLNGEVVNVAPEYEDVKGIANACSIPIKQVHETALSAYRALSLYALR